MAAAAAGRGSSWSWVKMLLASTGRPGGGGARVHLEVDAVVPTVADSPSSTRCGAAERLLAASGTASSADDVAASVGSLKATRLFLRFPPSMASSRVFIVAIMVVIP